MDLRWGGPSFVPKTLIGLNGARPGEVLWRTALGGALFAVFLGLCWWAFGRRLWARGRDTPIVAEQKARRHTAGQPADEEQPVGVAV
jgi:hypothetical protein